MSEANAASTDNAPWTRERVWDLLERSKKFTARCLTVLAARQTESERRCGQTTVRNGVGFNVEDAPVLTDIAMKLPRYAGNLTGPQHRMCARRLRKYWRQILDEIAKTGKPVVWPHESVSGELPLEPRTEDPSTRAWRERLAEKAAFAEREAAEERRAFESKALAMGAWA